MGSDRARVSYDPSRHWRGVINQQGRVTLEADWNEAAAIAAEDDRAQLVDVIGPSGTPDDGYGVVPVLNSDGNATGDLTITHGTLYVGGERMVLDADLDYADQPDWVDREGDPLWVEPAAVLQQNENEAVYLLLREQEVGAVEDPALLDVALGGPDTSERLRIVQRVVRGSTDATNCAGALADLEDGWAQLGLQFDPATMRLDSVSSLQVSFEETLGAATPCEPVAQGGYLGAENQLLRVQVASVDEKGVPTLAWGFDNAYFLYRISHFAVDEAGGTTTVTLASAPVDSYHQPAKSQAVEVLEAAAELTASDFIAATTGIVTSVTTAYNPDTQELVIGTALSAPATDSPLLFLRVWQDTIAYTGRPRLARRHRPPGDARLEYRRLPRRRLLAVRRAARNTDDGVPDLSGAHPRRAAAARRPAPLGVPARRRRLVRRVADRERLPCALRQPRRADGGEERLLRRRLTRRRRRRYGAAGADRQVREPRTRDDLPAGRGVHAPVSARDLRRLLGPHDPGVRERRHAQGSGRSAGELPARPHPAREPGGVHAARDRPRRSARAVLLSEDGGRRHPGGAAAAARVVREPARPVDRRLRARRAQRGDRELHVPVRVERHAQRVRGGRLRRPRRRGSRDRRLRFHRAGRGQHAVQRARTRRRGGSPVPGALRIPPGSDALAGRELPSAADDRRTRTYRVDVVTAPALSKQAAAAAAKKAAAEAAAAAAAAAAIGVPSLADAVVERNLFDGLTVPVLVMGQVGTARIEDNTVRRCYGGFWLVTTSTTRALSLLDRVGVGTNAVWSYLVSSRLTSLADPVLLIASVLGRILPLTPPSAAATSDVGAILLSSAPALKDAQNLLLRLNQLPSKTETAVAGLLGAETGDAKGAIKTEAAVAGKPALEAELPSRIVTIFKAPAHAATRDLVPEVDAGTALIPRLEVSSNQVDAVLADADSGTALFVLALDTTRMSSLVCTGNRFRSRVVQGAAVSLWALAECAVTGNIVSNEIPGAENDKSIVLEPEVVGKAPAVAVTGNVLVGPVVLPPRPLPAPFNTWAGLNTITSYITP